MDRNHFIPTKEHSSVWIPTDLKNGLLLKTVQDDNRFVSITLAKVLKEAGIQELNDTELLDRLGLISHKSKKSGRREIVVAK